MKVILLNDVEHLGRTGDVKEVAPGFARNYLLRRGLATEATQGALKQIQVLHNRRAKEDVKRLTEAQQLAQQLGQLELTIPARDRKSTRLNSSHGSISYAVFCLKK